MQLEKCNSFQLKNLVFILFLIIENDFAFNRFSLAPVVQLQQSTFTEQTLARRRTLLSNAQRLRRPLDLLPRRRPPFRRRQRGQQQHPPAQRSQSTRVAADHDRRRLRRLWKLGAEQVVKKRSYIMSYIMF